jgi:hypothetical protein
MPPERDETTPFVIRVRQVLDRLRYKDWTFTVTAINSEPDFVYLRAKFAAPDAESGAPTGQLGRRWLLGPEMTASDIVRTAFMAVLTAEEHEARENFLFDGRPVLGPHQNVLRIRRELAHDAA